MEAYNAIPNQPIRLELDPEAFPYSVNINGATIKLWPNKYKNDKGELCAFATFNVPRLQPGQYPLVLTDAKGSRQLGIVRIPSWVVV